MLIRNHSWEMKRKCFCGQNREGGDSVPYYSLSFRTVKISLPQIPTPGYQKLLGGVCLLM